MAKIINGSSLALALANYLCTNAYLNDTAQDVLIMVGNWIDEAQEITVPKWIPVSERLPEDDLPKDSKVKQIKVLVAYKTNGRWVTRTQIRAKGYFWGDKDKWDWIKTSDPINHWMPLPEPPKEE